MRVPRRHAPAHVLLFRHTPPPAPGSGTALVAVMDPAMIGPEHTACLSKAERQQAERFRFEKDAIHWRACRAALRMFLARAHGISAAEVTLEFGEFGKPTMVRTLGLTGPLLHFNLSHCRDLVVIALCGEGPVGVDIEPLDRATSLLGCEDAFCHPDEISRLPAEEMPRAVRLLDIWTRKEALLKALGTGMSLAPQTVSVANAPHGYAADPRLRDFRLHVVGAPWLGRHVVRLATPSSVPETGLTIRHWPNDL